MLKIIRLLALMISVFCLLSNIGQSQEKAKQRDGKYEAERLWEALIRMKGGREKLHSISNMLKVYSGVREDKPDLVELQVFPYRVWNFVYDLTDKPSIYLRDGTKPIEYWANENGITTTDRNDSSDWFSLQRVVYLLETKWDKPEFLRVTQLKKGKKKFDVIEAKIKDQRIDFLFEPEEMLVLQVALYNKKGIVWRVHSFSDYADINGIKMPQKQSLKSGKYMDRYPDAFYPVKFAFNVEYDSGLFDRSPVVTGPDGWKPQNKTN
jgi:hypothetical protein